MNDISSSLENRLSPTVSLRCRTCGYKTPKHFIRGELIGMGCSQCQGWCWEIVNDIADSTPKEIESKE